MTLHPSTSGFDRGAEVYDRARPGYPAALVDRLLEELGIGAGAVVADVAEDLPLADASVDAITVAQAFHWFANDAALAELRRVLRPGGRMALAWNTRDLHAPLQAALHGVLSPYRRDEPRRGRATGSRRSATTGRSSCAGGGSTRGCRRSRARASWSARCRRASSRRSRTPSACRSPIAVRALAPFEPVGVAYTAELFLYDAR